VREAQIAAQRLAKETDQVFIFGDHFHPEVRGVLAWAGKNATAIRDIPEVNALPHRIGIISQTTQSLDNFKHFLRKFTESNLAKISELHIFNTICDATIRRQTAALELAKKVTIMIVVGGKHSANTRRLAEICASTGVVTHHIETSRELKSFWFQGKDSVGITAGASTPDWIIDEVISKLSELDINNFKAGNSYGR
jgi:4-hydroxy-3-methylbut-2-enyl diphosphate reductase